MRTLLAFVLAAPLGALCASFECQRNPDRVERMICADAVISDLDDLMARFYAGASSALQSNAACLKADQRQWLRRRDTCRDTPCLDRAYRERLGELARLQPGMNLRRSLDLPEVAQLVGALAPHADRFMTPAVESRAANVTGDFLYDDRQGAFVVREKSGRQTIVLLDIMRSGDSAVQVPVIAETYKGAAITARGMTAGEPPAFDRRHCVYLYRSPP